MIDLGQRSTLGRAVGYPEEEGCERASGARGLRIARLCRSKGNGCAGAQRPKSRPLDVVARTEGVIPANLGEIRADLIDAGQRRSATTALAAANESSDVHPGNQTVERCPPRFETACEARRDIHLRT